MRTFILACFFVLTTTIVFSQQKAPLGKLLTKRFAALTDQQQSLALIKFTDKGNTTGYQSLTENSFATERSLQRRKNTRTSSNLITELDYPLERSYVNTVEQHVIRIRHQLKWFNAVSAIATKQQIEELRSMPFVKEIELIGRWKRAIPLENQFNNKPSPSKQPESITTLDYGTSYTQVNQINVPAVHNLGIYGQRIMIAVFDDGVRLLSHEALSSLSIIAQYDFVDHKESVVPNNTSAIFGVHGEYTLSAIGGYKSGQLIGPAFKSRFVLARTENDSSETPVEEDNWAKAAEWAESLGVQVISSSIGYLTYNSPYPSWTWEDMDGATTLITQAANYATSLGVVVVNSAGNDGVSRSDEPNSLVAPADGVDVITIGAVNSSGDRIPISSFGPTADGRTKPDVMALGMGVKVASGSNPTGYVAQAGTSLACPLVAGVAALLLCGNPYLLPGEVAEALRQTASNASDPNNYMGWGIVNALDALNFNYLVPRATVHGTIYNDRNGNGIRDLSDIGLGNVKLFIHGAMVDSALTDSLGNFTFDSLAIGTYAFTQTLPSGWIRTSAADSFSVALLFDSDTGGFTFGDFKLGSAHGVKFDDANHDGVQDNGELGLAGWKITLTGPVVKSTITNSTGVYHFTNIPGGTYAISESAQVRWLQSFPPGNGSHTIAMYSGLDTSGLDIGGYYQPNGSHYLWMGWNLLSLPFEAIDLRKNTIYPSAVSHAFIYDKQYLVHDSLMNGVAYWLKFSRAQNILFTGTSRLSDTIDVRQGWNMIGALSVPISIDQIQQVPNNLVISHYYGYGENGYFRADSLEPYLGYWVKVNQNGQLVLNTFSSYKPKVKSREDFQLSSLTISDADGHQQTLYFCRGDGFPTNSGLYDLPPAAPVGFDARFGTGKMVECMGETGNNEIPISIYSEHYPLRIHWNTVDLIACIIMDGREIPIDNSAVSSIEYPGSSLKLKILSPEAPKGFLLEQNFPNPFNPTTVIRYQVPVNGKVTLKIYNILGQELTTLVDEVQDPGFKSVEWDAGSFPSGIFFYKLTSARYVSVKKMVLIR